MIKPLTVCFIFAVIVTEVATWTLDLAEVTKFFLERGEVHKDYLHNANVDTNDEYDVSKYAKNFEYQNYDIKETNSVINSGSQYLDGLSKALLEYRELVDNCNRTKTGPVRPIAQFLGRRREVQDAACAQVMNNSEYVRRLSELVLLTTGSMRDKADKDYKDEDETALLARLAWLLDKLARLTGYEAVKNSSETDKEKSTEQNSNSPLEIMEPVENGRLLSKLPPKSATAKTKRSVKNPLEEVTNYYLKYKVWANSNPDEINDNNSNYDVQNYLKVRSLRKRSVDPKKIVNVKIIEPKKPVFLPKKPELHLKTKIALQRIIGATLKIKKGIQKVKDAFKHI